MSCPGQPPPAVVLSPPPRRLRPELRDGQGSLVADLALATRSEPFSAPGWLFELKYDGFRLLAAKDGSDVVLRYRSGRNVTSVFPEVAAAVAALVGGDEGDPAQRVEEAVATDGEPLLARLGDDLALPTARVLVDGSRSVAMAGQTSSCCARGR